MSDGAHVLLHRRTVAPGTYILMLRSSGTHRVGSVGAIRLGRDFYLYIAPAACAPASATVDGVPGGGTLHIDYLRPYTTTESV